MKTLWDIFVTFAGIGTLTFGGGYTILPLLQKNIAAKRGWATDEEITDYYAVAQCLPGVIAVNAAMPIGYKRKGIPGMLAAALGVIFPSLLIILFIAAFIQNFLQYEIVANAFNGIRVAVLALITDAVIKMWKSGVKDVWGVAIFAVSLAMFGLTTLSPVAPLIAGAVCGIVIRERKKK